MKKTIVLPLAMLFFYAGSFAQGATSTKLDNFTGNGYAGAAFSEMRKKLNTPSDLETVGSVYIDERFVPCKVYYNDEVIGNFYYRHNAFNDEVEIKDSQFGEEPESSLATIKELRLVDELDNKELALKAYKNKKDIVRNGYLYQLNEGEKYDLFFKNSVKFTEGTKPVNSMVRATPNKFSHFTEYYFMKDGDNLAYHIGHRKSEFLREFDKEKRDSLAAYIKEEKINLKKEEDLMKVFNYLNSI
ncbi:hypothetical protein [Sediminicola sp. 1XM1-17]|uniref:hypothetical protein n=1 Tax=Sediminicola sp. 1XM1-17 TaxID=3127702 RepID=UPI0030782C73